MAVLFQFQKAAPLNERKRLKAFIIEIFRTEGVEPGNISYVFCSDEYLLGINQQFLSHDFYTDIITFDISTSKKVDAEILISTDRVRENAIKFNESFQKELHRVIFHGILHLCGYKDKTKLQAIGMRGKEEHYLRKYGF